MGSASSERQKFIEKTSQSLPKKLLSGLGEFWNDYKKRKMGLIGLTFMLIIVGLALVGPLFVNIDITMETRQHAAYSAPKWASAFDPHSFEDQYLIDDLKKEETTYSRQISQPGLEGNVTWTSSKHTLHIKDYMQESSPPNASSSIWLSVNKTFTWNFEKTPSALLHRVYMKMESHNLDLFDDVAWAGGGGGRRVKIEIAFFIKRADLSVDETFELVEQNTELGSSQMGKYGIVLHSRVQSPITARTRIPGSPAPALQEEVKNALFAKKGAKLQVIQALNYDIINPSEAPSEEPATVSVTIDNTKCIGESHYYGLMGTNEKGAGLLPLIISGAQISLLVGFSVASAQLLIGVSLGLISGYYGGVIDEAIQRVVEFLLVMPTLPLWMVLTSIFMEIGIPPILVVWFVLTAFGWTGITKILRAQVLSEKEKPYIEAAEASGVPDSRIMIRHILPNVLPLVMMYVMLGVQSAILGEAALSFLNLGPQWNSWGRILQRAAGPIMGGEAAGGAGGGGALLSAWWYMFFPGLFLAMVGVGFMFIGLTIEAVVNPRRGI